MREEAAQALRELNEVVERLRAPGGCPWDRAQTHRSLRPYLLEETYELLEAIDFRGPETLREELGDLLLQVLMHCAIAAEEPDGFDIGHVAETTRAKMVHRHPHVFGDTAVAGAEEVVVNWERLKRVEKRERLSLLDGVPHALPALAFAQGVQKRPARVGFDETPSVADALAAIQAGVDAVARASRAAPPRAVRGGDWTIAEGEISRPAGAGSGSSRSGAAEGLSGGPAGSASTEAGGGPLGWADTASGEGFPAAGAVGFADSDARHAAPPGPAQASLDTAIGELLFAIVSLARQLRVNSEDALRERAAAYADRFRRLETAARAEGADLHGLSADEWRRRWEAAAEA
ncbi:MAG TPA: MazG family protein [Candidatus Binatia bacterium]|nr:MazG family protein [Candidatus Binatia bacterium]